MGVRYIFGQGGAFRTEPVIVAKNITENGTYDPATEGADGYAPVTVNVEGGGGSSDFSTAEVTVVVDNPEIFTGEAEIFLKSTFYTTDDTLYITADEGVCVENNKAKILMCGNAILIGLLAVDDNNEYNGVIISATGNISEIGSGQFTHWVAIGDGTITVHFAAIL